MTLRCKRALQTQLRWTEPSVDREGGFTLIELLVVLAVLGLALALIAGYKPPGGSASRQPRPSWPQGCVWHDRRRS